MEERPHVATLLGTLANYNVAIPSADEAEGGKAAPKVKKPSFEAQYRVSQFSLNLM